MTKTFTQDDCLLYYYGELAPEQIAPFEIALTESEELNAHYRELASTALCLRRAEQGLSERSIQGILDACGVSDGVVH